MRITIITLLCSSLVISKLNAQAPVITFFSPVSGGMYSTIYIHGQHLQGLRKVQFGNGVPSDFWQILSDTLIYAYPGPGATSGSVTVTNDSNQTASLNGFTFIGPPVINSFNLLSGHRGDTVTIKGANFHAVSGVIFGNVPADSFIQLSDSVVKAVVGNGASGKVGINSAYGSAYKDSFTYTGPAITSVSPMGGPGGTAITIRGIFLSNVIAVSVGGVAVSSFTVLSDTVINAAISSGVSGNVLVSSPYGYSIFAGFNVPFISLFNPDHGTISDTILIRGFNFTGAAQVKFGNTPAFRFTVTSDTVIEAVVGYGQSGNLQVLKGDDTVASTAYFQYHDPVPDMISFSPVAATTGMTVTIKGRHLTEVNKITFGGMLAANFTVQSDSLVTAVVGEGNAGFVLAQNFFMQADSIPGFFYFSSQPYIVSVIPPAAPVNTPVVIKGRFFNPNAAANIVYFGAVKAMVTGATDSSLTVTVPPGATYAPVSVTTNWLTAYSPHPFIVTFPGAMNGFSGYSFENAVSFKTPGSPPENITYGDFDGDGKTDIAIVYGYFGANTNFVSVYRNTSTEHYINFASPVNVVIGTQDMYGYDIQSADVDGDGKTDLVAVSTGDVMVRILRNTGSPGNISFAPGRDFITGSPLGPEGTNPRNVAISDFDGDDKPDIVVANYGLDNWCKITYMRNTSVHDSISFAAKHDIPVVDAYGVYAADLNNNQKPDLAVAINVNLGGMRQLNLFDNASSSGNIQFNMNEPAGANNSLVSFDIAFGDFDNDGKTDIVSADGNANSISLFRNTSETGGMINFEPALIIPLEGALESYRVGAVSVNDLDGDGQPDIAAVTNYPNTTVWLLKNSSTPGVLHFSPMQYYQVPADAHTLAAADINNDGRPEIITASRADTSFSVLVNTIGRRIKLCVSDTVVLTANLSGISYHWQVSTNAGASFSDLADNSNYSGSTDSTLVIKNMLTGFAENIYRCRVDNNNSNDYSLSFQDKWTGAVSELWSDPANWSCGYVPDINTDVLISSGPVTVNSNANCRTLTIAPAVSFTVTPGTTFTVAH